MSTLFWQLLTLARATSIYGDRYTLKSQLNQYVAIAALLNEHGDELELWCTDKSDEAKFMQMFRENPDML